MSRFTSSQEPTDLAGAFEMIRQLRKAVTRLHTADRVLIDVLTLETDETFAQMRTDAQKQFPLGDFLSHVLSGDFSEAESAINALQEQMLALSKEKPEEKLEESVQTPLIEKSPDLTLEDRVRSMANRLYEQSLHLPRDVRLLFEAFSQDRAQFQEVQNLTARLIRTLVEAKYDARLGVLCASFDRKTVTRAEEVELQEIVRIGKEARATIRTQTTRAETIAELIQNHRQAFQELADRATTMRIEVQRVRDAIGLFQIPCPIEIDRQFTEIMERLQTFDADADTVERRRLMLSFQPSMPNTPVVLVRFFENLTVTEALLLQHTIQSPQEIFTDAPSAHEALKRLIFIVAHTCNDPANPYFKGFKGKNSLLSILLKSSLVKETDGSELERLMDEEKNASFTIHKISYGWGWEPNKDTRAQAENFLARCHARDVVIACITIGKTRHSEEKYATRRTGTTNSD